MYRRGRCEVSKGIKITGIQVTFATHWCTVDNEYDRNCVTALTE
jgi:hypothetical protein